VQKVQATRQTQGVFQQGHSVTQWIISSLFIIGEQQGWNDSLCHLCNLLENAHNLSMHRWQ